MYTQLQWKPPNNLLKWLYDLTHRLQGRRVLGALGPCQRSLGSVFHLTHLVRVRRSLLIGGTIFKPCSSLSCSALSLLSPALLSISRDSSLRLLLPACLKAAGHVQPIGCMGRRLEQGRKRSWSVYILCVSSHFSSSAPTPSLQPHHGCSL